MSVSCPSNTTSSRPALSGCSVSTGSSDETETDSAAVGGALSVDAALLLMVWAPRANGLGHELNKAGVSLLFRAQEAGQVRCRVMLDLGHDALQGQLVHDRASLYKAGAGGLVGSGVSAIIRNEQSKAGMSGVGDFVYHALAGSVCGGCQEYSGIVLGSRG